MHRDEVEEDPSEDEGTEAFTTEGTKAFEVKCTKAFEEMGIMLSKEKYIPQHE